MSISSNNLILLYCFSILIVLHLVLGIWLLINRNKTEDKGIFYFSFALNLQVIAWLPWVINLLYVDATGQHIEPLLYFSFGVIPIILFFGVHMLTEYGLIKHRRKIRIFTYFYLPIYGIIYLTFLLTNITLIGTFTSPTTTSQGNVAMLLILTQMLVGGPLDISWFISAFRKNVPEELRKERRVQAAIFLVGAYIFMIGGVGGLLILRSIIFATVFFSIGASLKALGQVMPKWINNMFGIEKRS
jgi:hypothetical protein